VLERDDGVGAAETGESIALGIVGDARDRGLHALKRHQRYFVKSKKGERE
jgi:hypothetical protein